MNSAMFKLILITMLLVSVFLVSIFTLQKSNFEEDKSKLTQEIVIPDTDKDRLFSRCLLWIAKNYCNATSIIQSIDQEAGAIEIRCLDSFSSALGKSYYVYYISIFVYDNRVKVMYPTIRGHSDGELFTPDFKYEILWKPVRALLKSNTGNLFESVKKDTPVVW